MKEAYLVSFLPFFFLCCQHSAQKIGYGFIRRVYTYSNNEYEILLMRPPEQHAWLDVDEDGISHFMYHF